MKGGLAQVVTVQEIEGNICNNKSELHMTVVYFVYRNPV